MNNFLEIAILVPAKPNRLPAFMEKGESVNTVCLSCEQPGQLPLQCQGFAIPVSDKRHQQPGKKKRRWQRPWSPQMLCSQHDKCLWHFRTLKNLFCDYLVKSRNRREMLVRTLPLPFPHQNIYIRKHSNIFNTQIMVFRIILKDIFQIS